MIGHYLSNNNETCYTNFSPYFSQTKRGLRLQLLVSVNYPEGKFAIIAADYLGLEDMWKFPTKCLKFREKEVGRLNEHLHHLWACLFPRARNARRVFANAAPRPLFKIASLQFIFTNCTTRATMSRAFAVEGSAGLFYLLILLKRPRALANARNTNPNRTYARCQEMCDPSFSTFQPPCL